MMTIVITFHQLGYRDFTLYYIDFVCHYLTHRQDLPSLIRPSYRFVTTYSFSDIRFFRGTSKRGKGMMGWFYGFKLHLIIYDQGGII
ncbi:Mobile element protein [Candidatus Enterovibrio escicola]|uniref:Mobile element protein n=1 Tax=Candidatus Enterovibrio escicola TaxID=1927127 RepID=A0A2A5T2N1_9GAMM|nr:Mobile element protein [Candidatus Enterovibrio escacola]